MPGGSKRGCLEENARVCEGADLILPSHPFFAALTGSWRADDRGLFVTSIMVGSGADMPAPVVARLGDAEPARVVWRLGVKPVLIVCSALRRRGVVGCAGVELSNGALSAENI